MIGWLAIGMVLAVLLSVATVVFVLRHPAVRLRREVRAAVRREQAAVAELDREHAKAKAEIERTAEEWWSS
ncbi:hypothetical protein [Fodinicola acaciae]|uniref:hypothetical protein n=1 Tax=Fodinicola acaciae TaxID=2681555 RepID=UPI0013D84C9A|nr:hypothetical protein [Fodinicola acaciae]